MYIHMWIHTHKHTQQTTGERQEYLMVIWQTMHQDLSPISFITLKKVTPVVDSKGKMQEEEDKQSGLTVIRTHSALPEVRRGQHVPNVFSLGSSGFWTERDKILLVRQGELMAWKQKGHKWWASAEFSSEENRSSRKKTLIPGLALELWSRAGQLSICSNPLEWQETYREASPVIVSSMAPCELLTPGHGRGWWQCRPRQGQRGL